MKKLKLINVCNAIMVISGFLFMILGFLFMTNDPNVSLQQITKGAFITFVGILFVYCPYVKAPKKAPTIRVHSKDYSKEFEELSLKYGKIEPPKEHN